MSSPEQKPFDNLWISVEQFLANDPKWPINTRVKIISDPIGVRLQTRDGKTASESDNGYYHIDLDNPGVEIQVDNRQLPINRIVESYDNLQEVK